MVGAVGGEEVGVFVREGELSVFVLQISRAGHAFQPLLDIARLQLRGPGDLGHAHRALALHGAEQPGARADEGHAGAHRARHVAEDMVDGELDLFLIHSSGNYRRVSSSGTKSYSPIPWSTRNVAEASPPLVTRCGRRGGTA